MFTNWDQVESWIRDNNFAHWIITRNKPEEESKKNDILVDSNYYTGDDTDKIAMTKKYLVLNGGRGYGVGFRTPNSTVGGVVCEIRLEDAEGAPVSGMQQNVQPLNIGEIEDRVRRQVKAELEAERYANERKAFEEEKKRFEEEKQSGFGAMMHYFAPIGKMLLERGMMRNVAGLDAEQDVHARRIKPIEEQEIEIQEEQTQEPFTDEENEELYDLMVRFKKAEPENWLKMIRTVVAMAESNDATYQMAKGFLIK